MPCSKLIGRSMIPFPVRFFIYVVSVEPCKALPLDCDVHWNTELMTLYQGASRGYSSTTACVFLKTLIRHWRHGVSEDTLAVLYLSVSHYICIKPAVWLCCSTECQNSVRAPLCEVGRAASSFLNAESFWGEGRSCGFAIIQENSLPECGTVDR